MAIATLLSAGIRGIDAFPIHVEVDLSQGLPGWSTVGLAESAVKESKERVLSAATLAKEMKLSGLIVPEENVWEAEPIQGISVLGAPDLPSVVEYFLGQKGLKTTQDLSPPPRAPAKVVGDFSEVKGQAVAKRALEIAAAGNHNLLMMYSHTR